MKTESDKIIIEAHDKTGPALKQALEYKTPKPTPVSFISAWGEFSEALTAFQRASAEALGMLALVKWLLKHLKPWMPQ